MNTVLNRRRFLKHASASVGVLPFLDLHDGDPAAPRPRNKTDILFLLADDYTFDSIHALGCSEIQTPNLDRLIRRGTCFTNCYNQGGWHGAVCVASRTMLLTGRFLWDAQQADRRMEEECDAGRLWPHYLRQAGYHTYMSGKWHVNCNPADVFKVVRTVRPGMPPDIPAQYDRPKPGRPDPFRASDPTLGGYFSGGQHWSETVGDDGVAFLREAANCEEPFFMYLSFNAPHDPRQAPEAYLNLYAPEALSLPENFQPEHADKEAIGCGPDLRDEQLAPFPRTEQAVRAHRREYYAIISHLDAQIGRILDTLEASGRAENTCIIFTADNGLALGCHGLMGKQNMYEHSMKVPLIVAGPGIPEGKCLDALVYMQDVVPTTLELVGVSKPAHIAYQSLVPLIRGMRTKGYTSVYGAYMDLQRMVRMGNKKLIYYPRLKRYLLFDLAEDRYEKYNLADDPKQQTHLIRLKEELRRQQQDKGDALLPPTS